MNIIDLIKLFIPIKQGVKQQPSIDYSQYEEYTDPECGCIKLRKKQTK